MTDLLWVGPNQMIPVGPIQVITPTVQTTEKVQVTALTCTPDGVTPRIRALHVP